MHPTASYDRDPDRVGRSADARRLVVLLAVTAAHAGLWALLREETDRRTIDEVTHQEPALVWLPPLPDSRAQPAPVSARPSPRVRTRASHTKSSSLRAARAHAHAPSIAPSNPSADQTPTSPPIDWKASLEAAAAHQLTRTDEERRESAIFTTPTAPASLAAPQPHGVPFRWDYAPTHRIELTPQGALYINLNDRCLYMFPIFLFCRFGEIPSHSDLLEHMKDAPAATGP